MISLSLAYLLPDNIPIMIRPEGRKIKAYSRYNVCSASNRLIAALARPDPHRVSFDSVLSTECACVPRVLRYFHLLYLFPQRGTISTQRNVLVSIS